MAQISWKKSIGKTIEKISHHKSYDGEQLQIIFDTGEFIAISVDFISISVDPDVFVDVEATLVDAPLQEQ